MVGLRTRVAAVMLAAIAHAEAPATAAWERFHGDAANRGFADVATKPAAAGSTSVPGLGTFATGAGPVIAADGTVYLGTQEGKLIALHADGKPFWSRDVDPGESIIASPAVGANGSIYVIGAKHTTTEERRGVMKVKRTVIASTLYVFNSTGAMLGKSPFPKEGLRAATTAPPNIASVGGREIILAPALYKSPNVKDGVDVRLIGFSADGVVVLDELATPQPGVDVVTGGGPLAPSDYFCLVPFVGWAYCAITATYDPKRVPIPPPMAGVAIFTFAGGGAPHVIVSDQRHTIVGFTITGSEPRLTQSFRDGDGQRRLFSPPMVLPNGHTLASTVDGKVVFAGPNAVKLAPVAGPGTVYGAPTLTVNGFAVVAGTSGIALINNGKVVSQVSLPPSYTSAAASRTHVFVSTTDAFVTMDADAQAEVQRFDWVGGGTSPPAIGPDGRVYAIASDILFIFPAPLKVSKPPQRAPGVTLQKKPGGQ